MIDTLTRPQYRYRFGSLVLDSAVTLPGFAHRRADGPEIGARFRFGLSATTEPAATDGPVVLGGVRQRLTIRRCPDGGYVLVAPPAATVTLTADRSALRWHVPDGIPRAEDAEFLVATVLPRVATAQHSLVLHAAALASPHGAVLLCGRSGAGKSTISATIAARTGWPLLGDDASAVEPGPGGVAVRGFNADVRTRVRPAPGAAKRRTAAADGGVEVRPGRLVVRLVAGGTPSVRHLRPAETLITLRDNLLRLDRADPQVAVREFTALAAVTHRITVVELHHPCAPATLAATVDRVIRLVETA